MYTFGFFLCDKSSLVYYAACKTAIILREINLGRIFNSYQSLSRIPKNPLITGQSRKSYTSYKVPEIQLPDTDFSWAANLLSTLLLHIVFQP